MQPNKDKLDERLIFFWRRSASYYAQPLSVTETLLCLYSIINKILFNYLTEILQLFQQRGGEASKPSPRYQVESGNEILEPLALVECKISVNSILFNLSNSEQFAR
ncbi:hypothetical protein NIES2130_15705 [Scytonema sp. HK-05]|nr:hypothetical protein NIES2130_15705 [Scytonema sp. HK-05]